MIGRECEPAALDNQWIITIGLDQPQERQHIVVPNLWLEQHIATPVLIDVAEVGIALRVGFSSQVEVIIVALQILSSRIRVSPAAQRLNRARGCDTIRVVHGRGDDSGYGRRGHEG